MNSEYVRMLLKSARSEFRVRFEKQGVCETCIVAKQKRRPSREAVKRAERPGQRIHADTCGGGYSFVSKEVQESAEFEDLPASEGGAKYFIVMTDDFSRYRKTVVLKKKNEVEQAIKEFIAEIGIWK